MASIARTQIRSACEKKYVKYRPFSANNDEEVTLSVKLWTPPTLFNVTTQNTSRPKYSGEAFRGLVPLFVSINQGSSANDRIGDKITVLSHTLRLKMKVGDGAGNTLRIFIFRPKQQYQMTFDEGGAQSISGGVDWLMMPVQSIDQPMTRATTDLFQIAYVKRLRLEFTDWTDDTGAPIGSATRYKYLTIKVPPGVVSYSSYGTADPGNGTSGYWEKPWYLWVISDSATSSATHPLMSCEGTIKWIDP